MSTDITPDPPRDDQGRFAPGPDPASLPPAEAPQIVDPKDALWAALSDRDRQAVAIDAINRQGGLIDENGQLTELGRQRWGVTEPQYAQQPEYEEYEDPGQFAPEPQGNDQYVTFDQLQQWMAYQQQQQAEARQQYEAQQREEQNIAGLSHTIESEASNYADIHKESMLFHSLRLQQQHPYMAPDDIVRNVKSQFDQAERERMANLLPGSGQPAPGMNPLGMTPAPSAPPSAGVPAAGQQQPMSIPEASRLAREQGFDLRTGL